MSFLVRAGWGGWGCLLRRCVPLGLGWVIFGFPLSPSVTELSPGQRPRHPASDNPHRQPPPSLGACMSSILLYKQQATEEYSSNVTMTENSFKHGSDDERMP